MTRFIALNVVSHKLNFIMLIAVSNIYVTLRKEFISRKFQDEVVRRILDLRKMTSQGNGENCMTGVLQFVMSI
jgi:hypothetical protein